MVVPIKFRRASPIATQFSWAEFASNIGYVTFYGGAALNAAGAYTYYLTTGTPRGEFSTNPVVAEMNFDFAFNKPMTMKVAPIIVSGTININNGTNGGLSIKVYHVNAGAAETQIGATFATPVETNAGANNRLYRFCATFTPAAKVLFKVGEILRLEINETGVAVSSLYHDPSNGSPQAVGTDDNEACGSQLSVQAPFKIN